MNQIKRTTGAEDTALVSYLTLRRVVGVLGVGLPVVVALWGFAVCDCIRILPSISDYYGLRTRDAFVGILVTIAWFMFTYRGHDRRDDIAGDLACVFALGVALSPNSGTPLEKIVHFGSATALFLVLAFFSFSLFTKSGDAPPTRQKLIRNRIYKVCGVVMLLCVLLIGLYYWRLQHSVIATWKPVFWLESWALWAFGISWFVKGETLWKDPPRGTPPL